ncbi:PREDICTED: uncharacterized protein LOC105363833 [Ceratosolen solmsi marchali]|uniref:Uncharacterized protein LOC105363833 n=1 Tax=Ceratosolen solmsi marchali TaxID=326594 RepID=A0AAJ6YKW3_9HYME|nr:PREDICTED: uncharacterized protein LOC105363833 [Ceratosolen solmsi marchali]
MTQLAVTLMPLLLVLAALAAGQRYQSEDGNYINGEVYGDYESPEPQPQRPLHPTPRSYNSAPVPRQQPAAPKPTPVAILKQINRHNEDGSYTYGFEGADGSFKIETKQANGEVKGKYGFVDDGGKVRVVEYGADQYGFQPSGEGITVAPPTLIDETTSKEALEAQKYQEYQEYQQPIPRNAPPRPALVQPRQPSEYQAGQYQPQYTTQQHTQAIYASAQQPRLSPKVPQPIFTPAEEPRLGAGLQSQLIQQQSYDEEVALARSNYKTGPVQFNPAPVQESQPRAQPQPRSGGGGILDQLARDYALPQGGAAPLHDISFGYY